MIFAAMESGDIDGTAAAMNRHIINAKARALDDVARAESVSHFDN